MSTTRTRKARASSSLCTQQRVAGLLVVGVKGLGHRKDVLGHEGDLLAAHGLFGHVLRPGHEEEQRPDLFTFLALEELP